jgi:hypothetical protein
MHGARYLQNHPRVASLLQIASGQPSVRPALAVTVRLDRAVGSHPSDMRLENLLEQENVDSLCEFRREVHSR